MTNFPALSARQCAAYFASGCLSGAVLGAGICKSWASSRRQNALSARRLCLVTGALLCGAFGLLALWRAAHFNSAVSVNGVPLTLWQSQLLQLFVSKNLPFLLWLLMLLIGVLWTARRSG